MKLLGWMHRKLRQNSSNDPFKDFGIGSGQSLVDDQEYYQRSSYSSNKPFRQAARDDLRKSFAGLEAAASRIAEDYYEEDSSAYSELFHGFLAIGTFGSETSITDHPATPTFPFSVDNITEKESEVTENELKLINDELEKVLIAEANKEDGCNLSSGRNSYVSMGRSSHGSTITLSGKTLDAPESNRRSSSVCPLQGYLFGSAIEMPAETTKVVGPVKKENRTSLGELFQKTKMGEEFSPSSGGKGERTENKEGDKSAVNLMKKMIKKKLMLHLNASKGLGTDSASPESNKLHKMLHMFHKKVHPENSGAAIQKQNKNPRIEPKRDSFCDFNGGRNSVEVLEDMDDIVIFPPRVVTKERTRTYKTQPSPLQYTLGGSESNGNREQWIKTDADCNRPIRPHPSLKRMSLEWVISRFHVGSGLGVGALKRKRSENSQVFTRTAALFYLLDFLNYYME
ncbi:hypothetical protein ACFE04_024575 [Oxalis oulophora]